MICCDVAGAGGGGDEVVLEYEWNGVCGTKV